MREKKRVQVTVTGAAGQISYSLIPRIASGEMFGPEIEIEMNLIELETMLPRLEGMLMELEDCAFPLLRSISLTSDYKKGFKNADWIFLIGAAPRKEGMERKDLLTINGTIFRNQGQCLEKVSKENCKVLVIGNPCNTNAYILKESAKSFPEKNIFAMTMLDQNRASALLAKKAGVHIRKISKMAIWGNHSTTQFPDFFHALINGEPAVSVIDDINWLKGDFIKEVQHRGASVIKARGMSSAFSAASAVIDTVRNLILPSLPGEFFSLAVSSDGSYGIPEGVVFSFPVRSDGDNWEVVRDMEQETFAREKINLSLNELLEEKKAVHQIQ